MKVRVGSVYRYEPCLLDVCDGRTNLQRGELVRVVNLYGCPPANTMGHCYVERLGWSSELVLNGGGGLVATASLVKVERVCTRSEAAELISSLRYELRKFGRAHRDAVRAALEVL